MKWSFIVNLKEKLWIHLWKCIHTINRFLGVFSVYILSSAISQTARGETFWHQNCGIRITSISDGTLIFYVNDETFFGLQPKPKDLLSPKYWSQCVHTLSYSLLKIWTTRRTEQNIETQFFTCILAILHCFVMQDVTHYYIWYLSIVI